MEGVKHNNNNNNILGDHPHSSPVICTPVANCLEMKVINNVKMIFVFTDWFCLFKWFFTFLMSFVGLESL